MMPPSISVLGSATADDWEAALEQPTHGSDAARMEEEEEEVPAGQLTHDAGDARMEEDEEDKTINPEVVRHTWSDSGVSRPS